MSSFDDYDYFTAKAIKLNGEVYYNSKDGPHENHWDILARVVKELRASVEEQQKLLDDIDADRIPVEFGYPAHTKTVPEGFSVISRDRKEYTDKARTELDIPPAPVPDEKRQGYGQPGYSNGSGECNCIACRNNRAAALANQQTVTI